MSDSLHTIRVHQPFVVPKQWVFEAFPDRGFVFTEDSSEAGRFSLDDAKKIIAALNEQVPDAVVEMDGI